MHNVLPARYHGVRIQDLIILFFLVLPVFWFSFPAVFHGIDNLGMLTHFDPDEAELIKFSAKIFQHGLVPMDGYYFAYPQLFYYIAGLLLGPYTFIFGVDHTVIAAVLRSMNVASIALMVIGVYFFVKRFFKSKINAVLTCFLLATTPQYLWWTVNSRPHPLENLFILAIFYYSFRIIEKYRKDLLMGAIIFTSLAMSVKYGGIFLIPVIWAACIWNIAGQDSGHLQEYLKVRIRLIYVLCSSIFICIAGVAISGFYLYGVYEKTLRKFNVNSLSDFLLMRHTRLIILFFALVCIVNGIWLRANILSDKLIKNRMQAGKDHWFLYVNKSFYVLIALSGTVFTLFLILNPTFWIFPGESLKAFLYQSALTSAGTSLQLGVKETIVGSGASAWFQMLSGDLLLTPWVTALFCVYLLFEGFYARQNWQDNREALFKRVLLLIYIVSLFPVLFIFVSHRAHHYLLPLLFPIYALVTFTMLELIKKIKRPYFKAAAVLAYALILFMAVSDHISKATGLRHIKLERSSSADTGVVIGKWLERNYPANIKIWKDYISFYVPPKFADVYLPIKVRDINAEELKKIDPDVLIITSRDGLEKVGKLVESGRLPAYKVAREEKYRSNVEDFTVVYILAKP
jgi:Dolichyl-phosphate-mannose-protein mannosyltransferase.